MKALFIIAVLLMATGCGTQEKATVNEYPSSVLEFEYIGELPSYYYKAVYHAKSPCKLFLMTHTSLDSTWGLQVKRRYVTVCSDETATLTEYDVKIK